MEGSRHLFEIPVFASGLSVFLVGIFFVYGLGKPFNSYTQKLLYQLNTSTIIGVFFNLGVALAIPLQNFPLYQLLEKRILSKSCSNKPEELEDLLEFNPEEAFRRSFYTDVRANNQLPNLFAADDPAKDLTPNVPWRSRCIMRVLIIVTEIGIAVLVWYVRPIFKVFGLLCLFASRFLAYIFPLAVHLHLKWFQIPIPIRVIDILFTILIILETGQATYYVIFRDWSL